MPDSVESVDDRDDYDCIDGIFILRTKENQGQQIKEKGNFQIVDYVFIFDVTEIFDKI